MPNRRKYAELMALLGYQFKDISLLETALTHPSYASEHKSAHYQRLEFLGDSVLQLAMTSKLYLEREDLDEGKLTRMRANMVREEALFEAAKPLRIAEFIRLSAGEDRGTGRQKPSIIADVFEAILAAVYLDGGMEEASKFVERALSKRLSEIKVEEDPLDYKSSLQEQIQADGRETPVYELVEQRGAPHERSFEMRVLCAGEELGRGIGRTKRAAQQLAAKEALSKMNSQ